MIAGLHLLRYVDVESVLHRADARTKVACLTGTIFALSFDPSWTTVGLVWAALVVLVLAGRIPRGARPRPPRLLLYAMALALFFGVLAGGEPNVEILGRPIGLGGVRAQLRFFGVGLAMLALALVIGWTTRLGDLPAAAAWLLAPLRWLRLPIDDLVAALTLAVRCLPLMADEIATTASLWSLRPKRGRDHSRMVEAVDFVATATSGATRRAVELGEAVANRGPVVVPVRHGRFGVADLIVVGFTAALIGAIVVL